MPTPEIAAQGYVLTPGRYVGLAEQEEDGEPFEDKMERLVADLGAQFAEGARLEGQIRENLRRLGYGSATANAMAASHRVRQGVPGTGRSGRQGQRRIPGTGNCRATGALGAVHGRPARVDRRLRG